MFLKVSQSFLQSLWSDLITVLCIGINKHHANDTAPFQLEVFPSYDPAEGVTYNNERLSHPRSVEELLKLESEI